MNFEISDAKNMNGKEVMVIPKKDLVTGHLTWADIVLSATNNVRHNVNSFPIAFRLSSTHNATLVPMK